MLELTLKAFSLRFTELVAAENFGNPQAKTFGHSGSTLSPAAKQLRRHGLLSKLQTQEFLTAIFSLIEERNRRTEEKQEALRSAQKLRGTIQDYQMALKKLTRMQADLESFMKSSQGFLEMEVMNPLRTAAKELETVASVIDVRRGLKVNILPSPHRKPADDPGLLIPVLDAYNFSLLQLPKSEADMWLQKALLAEFGKLKASKETVYKLVVAVFAAAGIVTVSASAIKQSSWRMKKKQ